MTGAHWLQLIGLTADIFGAFLIAREVLASSRNRDLLGRLARSLLPGTGGDYVDVLADISSISAKGRGNVVRGTAFLLIGFLFQLVGVVSTSR